MNGRLHFDKYDLYFESPTASCGSIPLVFDGKLNLLGDFDLNATFRPIDINAFLDTFQVDKFVPVEVRPTSYSRSKEARIERKDRTKRRILFFLRSDEFTGSV